MSEHVSAFADDVLGDGDATEIARRIAAGEISAQEAADAAGARIDKVNGELDAIAYRPESVSAQVDADAPEGPLRGVPMLIKDNVEVAGWPTGHGSEAFTPPVAHADSNVVAHFRRLGSVFLAKSTLPEFGFNASTEWVGGRATKNPWNTNFSAGASSGGSAALVAAGAVPIAHANDGGGSIRIPSAACGLVGLKPTRGRVPSDKTNDTLPIKIISDGVVSRTVRDSAGYLAALEGIAPAKSLPPIGAVTGPGRRRLKVGLFVENVVTGGLADAPTRGAVDETVALLTELGHEVVEIQPPLHRHFVDDFVLYWGFLGFTMATAGRRIMAPDFDVDALDPLTLGLRKHFLAHLPQVPAAFVRLRRSAARYAKFFDDVDVVVSPVVSRTTPPLGYLGSDQPFDQQFGRLVSYAAYTPLQNAAGGPGLSLPLGRTDNGLPIGVHFGAGPGDERTLLELAFELEQAKPFPSLAHS